MKALEKLQTGNEVLDRIQDRIIALLNPLLRVVLTDGRLVEDVAIGIVQTSIPHGLGRKVRGWIMVSQSADARIWQSVVSDDRFLYLIASSAVSGSIWVF